MTQNYTSIKDAEGNPLSEHWPIRGHRKVLVNGGDFKGETTINGMLYKTLYTPIRDDGGKIIGMWFVGTEYENLQHIMPAAGWRQQEK